MRLISRGPNPHTLAHYMRCKGYTPNYPVTSGKELIEFTKEIHNAEFPAIPSLKGLVVVHKILIDVYCGKIRKHWIENRYVEISQWQHFNLLKDLFEKSIKSYNEINTWLKEGWLIQAYEEIKEIQKRRKAKETKAGEEK